MSFDVEQNNMQEFHLHHYSYFGPSQLKDILANCMAWNKRESLHPQSLRVADMQARAYAIHKILTDNMPLSQLLEQAQSESEEINELKKVAGKQVLDAFYQQYAYTQQVVSQKLIASRVAIVPVASSETNAVITQGQQEDVQA